MTPRRATGGVPAGPSAASGSAPPPGGVDPPEGGGGRGREGHSRAAGVGGWHRGGGKRRSVRSPRLQRDRCAPTRRAPRLPTVIEKLPRSLPHISWLTGLLTNDPCWSLQPLFVPAPPLSAASPPARRGRGVRR